MKVVAKFAILYFLVSCVIFVALAYRTARAEVSELEASTTADLSSLGYGLSVGIASTWSVAGQEPALRIVAAPAMQRDGVALSWIPVRPSDGGPGESDGAQPLGEVVRVRLPVRVHGEYVGDLEVRRDLPGTSTVLAAQLVREVPFALLLAVVLAGLAVLFGAAIIGRPLQRMVTQARRIGAGDFSMRLVDSRRDEIGDLKRELNVMCDQLEEARRRLEDESTARTETLEQMRHLDRLRTVGTIASSLAHELGTPLNVLLIRGQELSNQDLKAEDVEEAGRTIVSQVEKMSRLVRQLLDFSRKTPSRAEHVSTRTLTERAVHLLRAVARKHNVELVVESNEDLWVKGQEGQLEQALTNLVINAIQAIGQGGRVAVRVEREDQAHPPGSARTMDSIAIRVEDTGSGIPEDNLARLFEPFYTTKAAGIGTGLGLSVAKGIVEDFGGWISATSRVGRGSTFSLHLPRAL